MNLASTSKSNEFSKGSFKEGDEFTFVDFLPDITEQPGFLKSYKYSDFRSLIDKANEWLQNYPNHQIAKCETVNYKIKGHTHIDYQNVLFTEYGEDHTNSYLKGLRIWITKKCINIKQIHKIGYFDLIPAKTKQGGTFSYPEFENLDNMITNRNEILQTQPFPGHIITIETQEISVDGKGQFQPEETMHKERYSGYVFILRIFYEIAEPQFEEIGIVDFIPDVVKEKTIFSMPTFETFSNLTQKASCWCLAQKDIRICNIQTIKMRYSIDGIKSNETFFRRSPHFRIPFVRVLRISYVRVPCSKKATINLKAVQQLSYKNVISAQLTSGIDSFENLSKLKERVSAWIKATGAQILSVETISYRTSYDFESNLESTLTYSVGDTDVRNILIIRLYLTDIYSEPPKEMLPPVPEIKQLTCCIL